ncbi:MAG: glycine C-acetyltransferase [Deltaproteobacteria bacterium]|nr:glycine C-acetyltransferase [Deltaproteobacteria bacterium]
MYGTFQGQLTDTLNAIQDAGTYKNERVILSPQGASIRVNQGEVLNFCANNYLGLSSHPELIQAAHEALDRYAFGMSSVRFICGTLDVHRELEQKIAAFLGTEDAILYSSCFDANGGVFEALFDENDAIISDALNHASIIDGVRLCKAKRYRYANNDMADLEVQLERARAEGARNKVVVTDGVFSMDGIIANLKGICDLAEKHDALVMVDDSHASGFVGPTGRGTAEHNGVMGRVDIITTTFGKAMGGASGGVTAAHREIVDLLRQRSRPYLFSNSLAPAIAAVTVKVIDILGQSTELADRVKANATRFRTGMEKAGFTLRGAGHAIVPVMIGDARLASEMADAMLQRGIYVIGFSYPVVPKGQARIRVQLSAGHTPEQVDRCIAVFTEVGRQMGIVP